MRKIIIILLLFFGFVGSVTAGTLSVRVEDPKSPTNKKDFKISFSALDLSNKSIEVKCFVKRPSEGFVQYDFTKSLPAGGGNGFCQVGANEINTVGTYQFYVVVKTTSETQTSPTISVSYDDVGPDTPISYTRQDDGGSCTTKIFFRTASDNGETARVELYRSENTSFNADSGTKIASTNISSDQDGQFTVGLPDCNKKYYYAIRAYDNSDNGSGVIGDSVQVITQLQATIVPGGALSVPVGQSQVNGKKGQVLGDVDGGEEEGEDLIEVDLDTSEFGKEEETTGFKYTKALTFGVPIFLIVLFFYLRKRKNSQ